MIEDLIGVPFVNRGRDVKKGLDCWGLFAEVQRRFGNDPVDVVVSAFDTMQINGIYDEEKNKWQQINHPEPGDAVVLALDPVYPDVVQHVGVYLGNGKFIHTIEKTGAVVMKCDHPFVKHKIRGFFRWTA